MKGRLLAAMLMAFVSGLFSLTPMADRLENQYALGLLYLIRQPAQPPPGAVVIALDKQSLEWLRNSEEEKTEFLRCLPPSLMDSLNQIRSPGSVPRAVHACLLAKLKEAGVKVVVFDILFGATGDIEDDEKLATALREHGSVAILVGFDRAVVSDGGSEILVEREVKPAKLFSESAAATGAFVVPRSGGPVYGYWEVVPGFAHTRSLPEAALGLSTTLGSPQFRAISGVFRYLWLYGAPGTIHTIPARDILQNSSLDRLHISSETVAFIGAADPTITNYPDTFPSFFRSESDANLSGVELLATAYLNLRHNQTLTRLSNLAWVMVVMAVAAAFGFAVQIYPSHPLLVLVGMTAIYLGLSSFAFASAKLFLPVATPLFFSMPAAVFFAILTRYRFARTLIMHLAPKPIARRMLTSMIDERGAAVSGEATVVFFDLIGSTAIGEKFRPWLLAPY
jgi:adenylate cyclase